MQKASRFLVVLMGLYFLLLPKAYLSTDAIFNVQKIEKKEKDETGESKKRFQSLEILIKNYKNQETIKKLTAINDFYNQFHYISENTYQGEDDYWKSPNEFIKDGSGDCEDFAIAKYFTAVLLGLPIEKLRIIYVKSLTYNRAHMVLGYYKREGSDPLILDNINKEILPASKRPDLIPIYSFNGEKLWLAKQQHSEEEVGSAKELNKWEQLMQRMQKGG